ncbi:Uncharacterised protein [uncultured archaeon]|nr:Uncharacterised protein [uncultured archaeon]
MIIFIDAKGSGICDVGDSQVFSNLRRHLGGVTIYRLHTTDYYVIPVALEYVSFNLSDSSCQRIGGCGGICSTELSIGEQYASIGTYRKGISQYCPGERRSHGKTNYLSR